MNKRVTGAVLMAMLLCELVAAFADRLTVYASGQSGLVSIAEARALSPGTIVTVEGVVTVPPGAFKSSLSDEGFAIQDKSGGIYVRMSEQTGLRLRRRVRVTGKLVDSNGLLIIAPTSASSVRALGRGQEVLPALTGTGKVGEATEGLLLRVRGTITRAIVSDPPYGFRLFLNDGTGEVQIYVSASTGITERGLQPGARVEVTGFGGQYKDHYEVNPRFPADIRLLP
jgi:uncharacterized protein YdeI (BOF family)